MDEQTRAAFNSASDTSKQLIALATGLLALEITFAKELIVRLDATSKCLVGISWVLLLSSVMAGIWMLLAITGSLCRASNITPDTVYGSNIRIPAFLQIALFVGGLFVTVWFGIRGVL